MSWISVAVLIALLLCVLGVLALMVMHLRKIEDEQSIQKLILSALQKPLTDPMSIPAASRIPERPALSPAAALEFYTRLAADPQWSVLAHRAQADARMALSRSRMLSEDGKAQAALFQTGVAWYASQLAIMPEAEINSAISRLKREETEKVIEGTLGAQLEEMRSRPARY